MTSEVSILHTYPLLQLDPNILMYQDWMWYTSFKRLKTNNLNFTPLWVDSMSSLSKNLFLYLYSHWSQKNLTSLCVYFRWVTSPIFENEVLHCSQSNLTTSWTNSLWLSRLPFNTTLYSLSSQSNLPFNPCSDTVLVESVLWMKHSMLICRITLPIGSDTTL